MPQVEISVGGRSFEVACQPGEEAFLQSAARMLDHEASALSDWLSGREGLEYLLAPVGCDARAVIFDGQALVNGIQYDLKPGLEARLEALLLLQPVG